MDLEQQTDVLCFLIADFNACKVKPVQFPNNGRSFCLSAQAGVFINIFLSLFFGWRILSRLRNVSILIKNGRIRHEVFAVLG